MICCEAAAFFRAQRRISGTAAIWVLSGRPLLPLQVDGQDSRNPLVNAYDLAGAVRVSRQFTHDVEQGKPTIQLGRVLLLLRELGIALNVDIPDEASRTLATLQPSRPRARRNAAQRQVARVDEAGEDSKA